MGKGPTRFVRDKGDGCGLRRGRAQPRPWPWPTRPLLKAAFFGGDPNWGRIAAALGSCGVAFDPAGVGIAIDGVAMFQKGDPAWAKQEDVKKPVLGKHIVVEVDLGVGDGEARVWTCDLTPEYVHINSHYTT